MSKLIIPELSLVVLIGPTGSGKSTFARKHFKPTEVLSSDFCRGLVSDDENDQAATDDAFKVLHFIAATRLQAGKLTVVDATNVQPEARKPLIALAREYHCLPVAIVFALPEGVCRERNASRPERNFGSHVLRQQHQQMKRSLRGLGREGFRHVYILSSQQEVDSASIECQPLWNNLRHEHGPFDIIGDVHGCFDELTELLAKLGYTRDDTPDSSLSVRHSEGRKAVFLGDLVDRGPSVPEVLRLVMRMVKSGTALCVPGNHDMKLVRKLRGKDVQITHGLAESLEQLTRETAEFRDEALQFLDDLVSHYVFDDGKLVVAHAGLKESLQGRGSGKVRDFALYGETTGETDEFGLPVRQNWAAEYRGRATVVYGHTPVPEPEWLNHTINIDTGCVFGGKLTALRYPERELISVPARKVYCEPVRPLKVEDGITPVLDAQQRLDDVLDIADVLGKRIISTRLHHTVTVREENAAAAIEVMSRFAANAKWLIYLPPTMSPSETSVQPGLLEHPSEAFSYYRHEGVPTVVCEEKHMGSRAVIIICKQDVVATRRFGVLNEAGGICVTRTGRRFFEDALLEAALIERIRSVLGVSRFWEEFQTDWACFDCELMPWSAKAQELLRQQYAALGSSARVGLASAIEALRKLTARGVEVNPDSLCERYQERFSLVERYIDAYRRYCWPVASFQDLKIAPFHLLATEGKLHFDKDHVWQMETLSRICDAESEAFRDPVLLKTAFKIVATTDPASQDEGISWWKEITNRGSGGMVFKRCQVVASGRRGLIQPAIKVRGPEYLRIIYGPEYTLPEHIERLRSRGLARKRSLALREFALGMEALERFTRREPLRRVHECILGILALESEPIDPHL